MLYKCYTNHDPWMTLIYFYRTCLYINIAKQYMDYDQKETLLLRLIRFLSLGLVWVQAPYGAHVRHYKFCLQVPGGLSLVSPNY